MKLDFLKQIVLVAVLFYAFNLLLSGAIFLFIHIPTEAVNLDWFILSLGAISRALGAPRRALRWLWPGETTPAVFTYLLPLLNCLLWGFFLAGLRVLWIRARK